MICLQLWPCPEAILKEGHIDLDKAVHAQKLNVISPKMNALCSYMHIIAALENSSDNSYCFILNSEFPPVSCCQPIRQNERCYSKSFFFNVILGVFYFSV